MYSSLSDLQPKFDPRPVHVGFVVAQAAQGQVFSQYFSFPLSISFHQSSIPIPITCHQHYIIMGINVINL